MLFSHLQVVKRPAPYYTARPFIGDVRKAHHEERTTTVKSDHWIRRMSTEHGMIEPFEDRQVRDVVISCGVSSYGCDLRVADEFRIFTNVNSTIVDPKNFDSRNFVEFKGPICIIPRIRSRWRARWNLSGYRETC